MSLVATKPLGCQEREDLCSPREPGPMFYPAASSMWAAHPHLYGRDKEWGMKSHESQGATQ